MIKLRDTKLFSSGPLENDNNTNTKTQILAVEALNNNSDNDAKIRIKVFGLNGIKQNVADDEVNIPPETYIARGYSVGNLSAFEIQFELDKEINNVLLSVFGKNENGNLIPAHRVLHPEFISSND